MNVKVENGWVFVYRFGPFGKGTTYLWRTLRELKDFSNVSNADIDAVFLRVCEEAGIKPASAQRSIQRWLKKEWVKRYHAEAWAKIGWDEDIPPRPRDAIRLIGTAYALWVNEAIERELQSSTPTALCAPAEPDPPVEQ